MHILFAPEESMTRAQSDLQNTQHLLVLQRESNSGQTFGDGKKNKWHSDNTEN
jgi:hypothetical protein